MMAVAHSLNELRNIILASKLLVFMWADNVSLWPSHGPWAECCTPLSVPMS
jgi:hypothetical protein